MSNENNKGLSRRSFITLGGMFGLAFALNERENVQAQEPIPVVPEITSVPTVVAETRNDLEDDQNETQNLENYTLLESKFSDKWPRDNKGQPLSTGLEALYIDLEIHSTQSIPANDEVFPILGGSVYHAHKLNLVGIQTFSETTVLNNEDRVSKFAYLYFAYKSGNGNGGVWRLRVNEKLTVAPDGYDTRSFPIEDLPNVMTIGDNYKPIIELDIPSQSLDTNINQMCTGVKNPASCYYQLNVTKPISRTVFDQKLSENQGGLISMDPFVWDIPKVA